MIQNMVWQDMLFVHSKETLHKVARSIEAGTVEINEQVESQIYHLVAINNLV